MITKGARPVRRAGWRNPPVASWRALQPNSLKRISSNWAASDRYDCLASYLRILLAAWTALFLHRMQRRKTAREIGADQYEERKQSHHPIPGRSARYWSAPSQQAGKNAPTTPVLLPARAARGALRAIFPGAQWPGSCVFMTSRFPAAALGSGAGQAARIGARSSARRRAGWAPGHREQVGEHLRQMAGAAIDPRLFRLFGNQKRFRP